MLHCPVFLIKPERFPVLYVCSDTTKLLPWNSARLKKKGVLAYELAIFLYYQTLCASLSLLSLHNDPTFIASLNKF